MVYSKQPSAKWNQNAGVHPESQPCGKLGGRFNDWPEVDVGKSLSRRWARDCPEWFFSRANSKHIWPKNISCLSHLTMLCFTAIELWFNHIWGMLQAVKKSWGYRRVLSPSWPPADTWIPSGRCFTSLEPWQWMTSPSWPHWPMLQTN